jgi:hypothetical protein
MLNGRLIRYVPMAIHSTPLKFVAGRSATTGVQAQPRTWKRLLKEEVD